MPSPQTPLLLLLLLPSLLLLLPLNNAFVIRHPHKQIQHHNRATPPLVVVKAAAIETNTTPPPPTQKKEEEDPSPESIIPKSLNPLQRITRAATFWSQVAPILGNYALIQRKIAAAKDKGDPITEEEAKKLYNDAHDWGANRLASTIMDLKGFYVKSGQVIASRVDMFPEQYTTRLQTLQDSVDPIPTNIVKAVIRHDLLENEPLETMFKEFDDVPLGSASIAQVHRAVLLDGREVAVKVQRPSEEPKLRGDIGNLKAFSKRFRDSLPVDYYRVFCELEKALTNELDFRAEAQAMEKIAAAVAHTPDGRADVAPVVIPRAINGLVSKRVIVMDFIHGTPLTKLKEKMAERGIKEGSPEAGIFARRLLSSLTESFSRMVFGDGFIHGDPHPGNIFVMDGGRIALIDCGQVKQIGNTQKMLLADLVLQVSRYGKPGGPTALQLSEKVKGFGVKFEETANAECGAALALLLFGSTGTELPGGYSSVELSAGSPLRQIKDFPSDLVMLGRASVIIKGIAGKVGLKWNLADKWAEGARMALECGEEGCSLPVYAKIALPRLGKDVPRAATSGQGAASNRRRFSEVRDAFRLVRQVAKEWAAGRTWESLPQSVKQFFINREMRRLEKKEAKEAQEEEFTRQQRSSFSQSTAPVAAAPATAPPPAVIEAEKKVEETEQILAVVGDAIPAKKTVSVE